MWDFSSLYVANSFEKIEEKLNHFVNILYIFNCLFPPNPFTGEFKKSYLISLPWTFDAMFKCDSAKTLFLANFGIDAVNV